MKRWKLNTIGKRSAMKDNRGHRKRRNHDQVEKKTNIKVTIEKHDSEENKKK